MNNKVKLNIAILLLLTSPLMGQVDFGNNPEAGHAVKVNGIELYYEIYGKGQPLLLLHGNGGSSRSSASIMPQLIKKYKVIIVDHRCHGQSGCSDELNYQLMASDINALLNHLKIESTLIYGHSDGGIIGLILGFKYPDKVKKLVVSGANIKKDKTALEPFIVDMMQRYEEIEDPALQKQVKLMVEYPNMNFNALNSIRAPTLLISGDRDAVLLSHTVDIFRNIPNSNLSVWPGTTHFVKEENPSKLLQELNHFFESPFKKPSTVDWAKQAAKQILPSKN